MKLWQGKNWAVYYSLTEHRWYLNRTGVYATSRIWSFGRLFVIFANRSPRPDGDIQPKGA